jgi:hypothetical protein
LNCFIFFGFETDQIVVWVGFGWFLQPQALFKRVGGN